MEFVQHVRKTDLARNTRKVISAALRGTTLVVENHGQPEVAIIDIVDYHILRAVLRYHASQPGLDILDGLSNDRVADAAEPQAGFDLVIAHYLSGTISLSRAAELLDLSWLALRTRFERLDVPLRAAPVDRDGAQEDAEIAERWAESPTP